MSIQTAFEPSRAHKAQNSSLVSDMLRPALQFLLHSRVPAGPLPQGSSLCSGTGEWKCPPQSHNLLSVPSCAFISLVTLGRPFFKPQLEKYYPPPKFVPRKINCDNGQIISQCPCLKSSSGSHCSMHRTHAPRWRARVPQPSHASSSLAVCSTLLLPPPPPSRALVGHSRPGAPLKSSWWREPLRSRPW